MRRMYAVVDQYLNLLKLEVKGRRLSLNIGFPAFFAYRGGSKTSYKYQFSAKNYALTVPGSKIVFGPDHPQNRRDWSTK